MNNVNRRDQFFFYLWNKPQYIALALVGLAGTGFGLGYVAHALFDVIFNIGFVAGYLAAALLA